VQRTPDGTAVLVTFRGKITAREGAISGDTCATELGRRAAHVVWDLTAVTGYDPAARIAWQNALSPVRHRIRSMEVIGGSPLVRLGTVTLTMTLGLEVTFRDDPRRPERGGQRAEGEAQGPRRDDAAA